MKFLALAALTAGAYAAPHWSELTPSYSYEQWAEEFKAVSPVEPSREAFAANLERILAHNKGQSSWKAGVNKVSRCFLGI